MEVLNEVAVFQVGSKVLLLLNLGTNRWAVYDPWMGKLVSMVIKYYYE